jgi:Zn finger protein HypA/HybF involved in hydrogenase expression
MEVETYKSKVKCTNCGWKGEVSIPKGIEVYSSNAKCPNCGCDHLSPNNDKELKRVDCGPMCCESDED